MIGPRLKNKVIPVEQHTEIAMGTHSVSVPFS
jgi:hypothetical protein